MDEIYSEGIMKWYNRDKGFGFIQMPDGKLDVFVHANQLRKSGIERSLIEGEKVRFQISKGPRGAFALNISVLS